MSKLRLDDGASGLLLIDSSLSVSLHPDTPAVRRAVHARVDDLFFYLLFKAEAAPSLSHYLATQACELDKGFIIKRQETLLDGSR